MRHRWRPVGLTVISGHGDGPAGPVCGEITSESKFLGPRYHRMGSRSRPSARHRRASGSAQRCSSTRGIFAGHRYQHLCKNAGDGAGREGAQAC